MGEVGGGVGRETLYFTDTNSFECKQWYSHGVQSCMILAHHHGMQSCMILTHHQCYSHGVQSCMIL